MEKRITHKYAIVLNPTCDYDERSDTPEMVMGYHDIYASDEPETLLYHAMSEYVIDDNQFDRAVERLLFMTIDFIKTAGENDLLERVIDLPDAYADGGREFNFTKKDLIEIINKIDWDK